MNSICIKQKEFTLITDENGSTIFRNSCVVAWSFNIELITNIWELVIL